MDKESAVILFNPSLSNQKIYADYLVTGFQKIGVNAYATSNKEAKADIYVCIGPHYALNECLGKNALYIDRCLWGDDLKYVTIGWLRPDGGMLYPQNSPDDRPKPDLKPYKTGDIEKALVLLDYGPYPNTYLLAQEIYQNVKLRPHPAARRESPNPPLHEELQNHDIAIGHRTSALFTAAVEGLPVISLDMRSPVWEIAGHDLACVKRPDRIQWLSNMSYAQWSGKEIESGEALNYVINSTNERAGDA